MIVESGRDDWPDATRIERDVDETCDRFEAAWRAGNRPSIEDFLVGMTDSEQGLLFRHLLELELAYRGGLGESPGPAEYRRRFPGHEGLVSSVFIEFARQSTVGRGGGAETLVPIAENGPRSGAAVRPPPDAVPNIPGSEILSELGRGGMGIVYLARQVRLNRLCALKITLPRGHNGAEFRARFLAEAETIARLRHPNIVQIYGLGDLDGRPYFEMEYIEGGSLTRRLDGTPWPPEPAARLVAMLARAIGAAHRLGIVHRDLKPANVRSSVGRQHGPGHRRPRRARGGDRPRSSHRIVGGSSSAWNARFACTMRQRAGGSPCWGATTSGRPPGGQSRRQADRISRRPRGQHPLMGCGRRPGGRRLALRYGVPGGPDLQSRRFAARFREVCIRTIPYACGTRRRAGGSPTCKATRIRSVRWRSARTVGASSRRHKTA